MTILQVNSHSIDQKSGEIWTGQADLQPIFFKSDRLLGIVFAVFDGALQSVNGFQLVGMLARV